VEGKGYAMAHLGSAEEYAVECAILKVFGSEVLDYVADEGVQIYGGYGYSADYPVERAYRDSRINRIFEGTNEINRLLTVDMLLKRAMKGQINLMAAAKNVQNDLMAIPEMGEDDNSLFAAEKKAIMNMKKAILMVAGSAVQKYMLELSKEQEIIMNIADMMIETYAAESVMLRTEKLLNRRGEAACGAQLDMMRVFFAEAGNNLEMAGREAINSMAEGDEHRMMMLGLKRFTKTNPFNSKEARRRIAKQLSEAGKYPF
ncbi:MAG: acyl-CoA dehydrogenase family protein, partial [Bacteroidota bacterium]